MALTLPTRSALTLPRSSRGNGLPRSQAERLWLIGGGLLAAVLMLIGYAFFISPQRSSTDSVESQIAQAQTHNSVLQSRLNSLRAENASLPKYAAALAAAQLALPSTSGISDFVRSLQSLANSTNTQVSAVTVGPPTAVVAAVAPAAAGKPAPVAGAAPAAPSAYSMAITTQVTGRPSSLDEFLKQLQSVQPRAVLITSVTESAGNGTTTVGSAASSGTTTLAITLQAFVAPSSSAAPVTTTPTR